MTKRDIDIDALAKEVHDEISKLSETAKILYDKYGRLTINMNELASEIHMRSGQAVVNAVSARQLDIHTYRLGRYRVCDIRDLARYLDQQRAA